METAGNRLEKLRRERFASRRQAAVELGIPPTTYNQYETGEREFSRHAVRFAKFFRVNVEWLLTGRGEMRPTRATHSIPLMGVVAAGSSVIPIEDQAGAAEIDAITLPEPGQIAALLIKGDSMYPRFMEGEYLLYDPKPRTPGTMIGHYAVAQTLDGRVMVKKILSSRLSDHWKLWSHNAPEEDVQLLTCYKILGTLI